MTAGPAGDRTRRATRETYDRIAAHFAETRANPWPEVERFVEERAGRPSVALDVGCGNGRHAALLVDRADRVLGIDASRAMLATARRRLGGRDDVAVALLQGDAARLPLAPDTADLAVYVAAVHHLPTREARVASLDELERVLRPGGRALVSAWATTHDRFDDAGDGEGFDTTVDWTLPDGERVPRFYHVYAPPEFDRDLAASALSVVDTWLSSGNCYAVVSA